ncbi:hypothetical protein Elgi_64460 [Paenibacillus elgii]|nr:hypothetical protein Elgi_64460 [Paenibacillus elgii]
MERRGNNRETGNEAEPGNERRISRVSAQLDSLFDFSDFFDNGDVGFILYNGILAIHIKNFKK